MYLTHVYVISTFISYIHPCMQAKSLQLGSTLCDPVDCSPPGSSVHGILQARRLEWVVTPSSRGSSRPRDWIHISYIFCTGRWEEPRSLSLQGDPLPAEPQGNSKNTGMGSLSLFHRIFLYRESNLCVLHCRRILYQLSYQGLCKGSCQLGASLVAQMVKRQLGAGDLGSIPGSGRYPGEGKATHSIILAWRIPWTEEPGGLQSMGS